MNTNVINKMITVNKCFCHHQNVYIIPRCNNCLQIRLCIYMYIQTVALMYRMHMGFCLFSLTAVWEQSLICRTLMVVPFDQVNFLRKICAHHILGFFIDLFRIRSKISDPWTQSRLLHFLEHEEGLLSPFHSKLPLHVKR